MKVCPRFCTQINKKSQHIFLELGSVRIDNMEKAEKFEVE